ncbi:hypothetical protein BDW71DRAFT_177517 [Aspergillus fruticulosus]
MPTKADTPRRATTSSLNNPTTLPKVTSSLIRKGPHRHRWCTSSNLPDRRRIAGVWAPGELVPPVTFHVTVLPLTRRFCLAWQLSAAASFARKPASAVLTALSAARCVKTN